MNSSFALKRIKELFWIVAIAGAVVAVGRFAFGLGAATHMTDALPWGFWKIFNMVAGAALATSGFVVATVIYIFQLHRYRSVARLSVLVGFLGYGSSLTALLFDIGLPHRGWHAFFIWNPHSFLFEVFWCVSLYWGVTALELFPILTERFPWPKLTHFLHEYMLPPVVLGITLSTMHHSSLGSLFLASPTRLHPLWHTMWLPPEFFVSAMGAGIGTIILLMITACWLYRREIDTGLLSRMANWSGILLALYFVIKVADFTINKKWGYVVGPDLTWESYIFWIEISLQAIVPMFVFAIPQYRKSLVGLCIGSSAAFFGLAMHRLDSGIVGYFRTSEAIYIPSISEFVLSFGVLSTAGLVFFFLVERFHILDEPGGHGERDAQDAHAAPQVKLWTRKEAMSVFAGSATVKVLAIAIVVAPVSWFAFRSEATGPFKPTAQPVFEADDKRVKAPELIRIDSNNNGDFADFTHKEHIQTFMKEYSLVEEATCEKCHHLSLPVKKEDIGKEREYTNCRVCHKDMEVATLVFNLEEHSKYVKFDLSDRKQDVRSCIGCHRENMPGLEKYELTGFNFYAPGFKQAMHGLCLTCHRLEEADPADALSRGNCLGCHRAYEGEPAVDEPPSL
jgi:Ni/Fe-hydrogenase subunit HybB-like protein